MLRQKNSAIVLWPAAWSPASCWWPWWLWCHLLRGQNQSGCLQLQHWTAGWWRKTACRRPVVHCPPLWCVGAPPPPCWGYGGRCSRGQTADPGTYLHFAHLHPHAPLSGCWRWSAGDLHGHTCTHTHTNTHQTRRGTTKKESGRTHANTVTHTYIPVVTYVHTYTHKSVWVLHNSPPPSHGERMG